MLKKMTFGQYIYGNSIIHRLDPRLKLLFTVLFIVMVFSVKNIVGIISCIIISASFYFIAKIPLKIILRSLRPIIPLILFTVIINMFFVAGEPIISFWKITISKEGIYFSAMFIFKIVCLIAGSSILTYTTSPIELTDAIERVLMPFKFIKMPVHELAMMMTIALRFIPTLIEETDRIMSAQKSRGADIDTGNLLKRVKALVPILVPLFISAFRRADDLTLAMECRCYRGGEGRTRLKQLKYKSLDLFSLIVFVSVFACVLLTNSFITAVI